MDTNSDTRATPRRLLVAACGSVAALTLPTYLTEFRMAGVERIAVALSATANTLIPHDTLAHVCDGCYTDTSSGPGHVALARWADALLLIPATAHAIGCLANGLAPSLVTTILLAHRRPIIVVPAMNEDMWGSPAVQRNVQQIRSDGHVVLDPLPGRAYEVASRTIRDTLIMAPPQQVIAAISRAHEHQASAS